MIDHDHTHRRVKMSGKHYGFQAATLVQPANGGHAYLFGSNASENELSEEDGESYELRSRGRERQRRSTSRERMDDIVLLTRDILEGDTLNSIALQYHCSVADLKRANSLLTEQDFFALRAVKIPVKRFSVLTETHNSGPLKSASPTETRRLPHLSPVGPHPYESSTESCSSTDSVEGFLLEKDKDIERLVKSSGPSRSSLQEVVSSLTLQQQPAPPGDIEYKPVQRKDPYYGADWGMRWWTAVAIMLFVGIITPVFYLLYYEVLMKADVSHHGNRSQTTHHPPVAHLGGNSLNNAAGGNAGVALEHEAGHVDPPGPAAGHVGNGERGKT
ncbi:lysM and putative peptidoglycan-binding domain-containing protein 3 [Synchiropus picturatus]